MGSSVQYILQIEVQLPTDIANESDERPISILWWDLEDIHSISTNCEDRGKDLAAPTVLDRTSMVCGRSQKR